MQPYFVITRSALFKITYKEYDESKIMSSQALEKTE